MIDTKSHQVITNWPIAPGEEASGMAIDLKNHRLFLGCGGSKTMVMMDSTSGKIIASVPIGQGVDANAFDPGTGFAFASCGDGTTTIAHEDTPDKLTVVQTLETQRGSRTMTHRSQDAQNLPGRSQIRSTGGRPAARENGPGQFQNPGVWHGEITGPSSRSTFLAAWLFSDCIRARPGSPRTATFPPVSPRGELWMNC